MLLGHKLAAGRLILIGLFLVSLENQGVAAGSPALREHTITVNGAERIYFYYVSSKSNSFNGQSLVFALHDNGQSAVEFANQSGWIPLAEENGFAVVFPQADNNAWTPSSSSDDAYLKAVFDHAAKNMVSKYPGDVNAAGETSMIWCWEPLRYLTGNGAGGAIANAFALNYPGLFAGVATLNGVAPNTAYAKADEPAQAYFQFMRNKKLPPVWTQLKKEVAVPVWMFTTGEPAAAQTRQAQYWRASNKVAGQPATRTIGGFTTRIERSTANEAWQVRETRLDAGRHYDVALASAIWNDMFAHLVRWTSSPNGDLTTKLTQAEVEKQFEVRKIDAGGGDVYQYYLKLPSSYQKGQKLPLVLSTHGANEQAWLYLSKIKMHELGEKEGFITVYPNGHKNHWNNNDPDGRDAKFLELLVKDVIETYGADQTRVYMQGFSNGSAMTNMMGLTHPQLFAAVSPNNADLAPSQEMLARIAQLKAKYDYRMPVFAVHGAVDMSFSVDGKMLAQSRDKTLLDIWKKFNHIATPDRVEAFPSLNVAPYDQVVLGGKLVKAGIDDRYPNGRFQIWQYFSDDSKPLNLYNFAVVTDLPHAYDFREAKLQWDYFKQFSRNADGSLNQTEPARKSGTSMLP